MLKQPTSPWREFLTGVSVTHLQDCNECFTHFNITILKLDTLSISMKQHLEKSLKLVDHIETLRVSPRPQEQMEKEFSQDQVCKSLKQVILEGWPGNTRECDPVPHLFKFQVQVSVCLPFFQLCGELTVQRNLIFRGYRLFVPSHLRKEIMCLACSSHICLGGCFRHLRECMFWTGMSSQLKVNVMIASLTVTRMSWNPQCGTMFLHILRSG